MKDGLASSPRVDSGRWLLAILLLAALPLLAACGQQTSSAEPAEILAKYLPSDWTALTGGSDVSGFQEVNIDGDKDSEWLYFFHYDGQQDNPGPIGGIIYDAQQDVQSQQPAAFFVPYRLLPDWRDGKGQGYLGEKTVSWSEAWIDPEVVDAPPNELVVTGLSAGDLVTRLSLFRWLDIDRGYGVSHFVGNAGLLLGPSGRTDQALIGEIVAYNRLNDRTRLCEKVVHTRQGTDLRFVATQPAIVFCPLAPDVAGVPDQPTYPEAVVIAWLLGGRSATLALDNDALKAVVPDPIQRVMHVQYPGAATPVNRGEYVSQMNVQTVLETPTGPQTFQWNMVELRPNETERTSRWRIASVQKSG